MNNSPYNILITGGAGYLGSVMVRYLLEAGHQVTVLDNFMFRQDSLNDLCSHEKFDVYSGDAREKAVLEPLCKKADIIIPLAALVGAPLCDFNKLGATSTNRDAIFELVNITSLEQRIILPITNSGYGIGKKDEYCTEESPLNPISLYGRTKIDAENAVLERGNSISFRLATVFGMSPRMRIDLLVNDFVYRAVNDRSVVLFEAHFKRNFIHVRDVANVFLHGINKFSNLKNNAYNVGLSNANLSKLQLCQIVQKHLPKFAFLEAKIGEDPDKRDYIVSNEKIEQTGFMPQYSLDDGIRELIKGYRMMRGSTYGNM